MTSGELAAKAAADSAARTKAFDDDTLLAARAFAYGAWDKYFAAQVADIERDINNRFGATGTSPSTAGLANPADLGKPLA